MNLALLGVSSGVGAVIGYVTNYVAIKLLFRPYKPIKIGEITVFPQGVIPKEKDALAKKVGEVVKNYILSEEEIKKIITSKTVQNEIENFLDIKIKELLNKDITEYITREEIAKKLSDIIMKVVKEKFSMFSALISQDTVTSLLLNLDMPLRVNELIPEEKIKEVLKNEIFQFLEKEVPAIFIKADIDKIVEEKIKTFDEKTLEDMLFTLMKKHFGFINFAGALLGGIIGFVQYFIVTNM